MGLEAITNDNVRTGENNNRPKGPKELAKALGITVEQLKKMSPKDVEKLAKEKGIDLKEYGRPDAPPPQKGSPMSMNEGILKFKSDLA